MTEVHESPLHWYMNTAHPEPHPGGAIAPTEWVDRYEETLYRFALSPLRNVDSAEEVVQETFVAALRARDQYSGEGAEGAWMLGICKRKIVDFIRRRNRLDAGVGADVGEDPTETLFDKKGNWRFDPRMTGLRPEASLERIVADGVSNIGPPSPRTHRRLPPI